MRPHSNKVLALLAYLALRPQQEHSRAALSELLWSGAEDARHGLRQALYSARRSLGAIGKETILGDRGWVRFQPHQELHIDASEYLTLIGESRRELDRLQRAVALYNGPFMQDLEFSGQPAYNHWLRQQRASLQRRQRQALLHLSEGHLRLHHLERALQYGQQLIELDPLDEQASRILLRVHAARRDWGALDEQHRHLRDLTRRELNQEVSEHTKSLYRRLTGRSVRPDGIEVLPPLQEPHGDQLGDLTMEGRENALNRLDDALARARAGSRQVVLISGEPGIGKSRLLNEFIDTSASLAKPARALYAGAPEHELMAPYTLWAEALRPLTTPTWRSSWRGIPEAWRAQIERLLLMGASGAPRLQGLSPRESRLRLHQGVARTLTGLAERTVLILALDDLQWIDEASLGLLSYTLRHAKRARLLVVCVYQPGASSQNLPWSQFLAAPDLPAGHIQLGPLKVGDVRRLLERLPAEFPEDLPQTLHTHSGGNPLILLETLRALHESGHLVPGTTHYRLELAGSRLPVPSAVQDLVRHRVADLSRDAKRALAAAAVIGRAFNVRTLHQVTGQSEPFVIDICHDLERRALFASEPGQTGQPLDFAHDYYRRAIYNDLSPSQRQALHLRAAETLQGQDGRSQPILKEIAFHFDRARDPRAVEAYSLAAQGAVDMYAFAHAAELSRRGLEFAGRTANSDPRVQFELLTTQETALDRLGRRAEQTQLIEELLSFADSQADRWMIASALRRKASLLTYLGDYKHARTAGERAIALLHDSDDRSEEARALRDLAFNHWGSGDFTTALDYARQVLNMHRSANDVSGQASALHNLAEIHRELGSPRRALDLYQQAIELHWSTRDLKGEGLALYGSGHAQRQIGAPEAAEGVYRRSLEALQRAGDRLMTSRVHHALAGLYMENDRTGAALEECRHALSVSREIAYGPGIAHGLTLQARLLAETNETEPAAAALSEAIEWLHLLEDEQSADQALQLRERLIQGEVSAALTWPKPGWFRSHIPLEEGKVYCAFESPLARSDAS